MVISAPLERVRRVALDVKRDSEIFKPSTNWWQNENVSVSGTGAGFYDFYDITPNSIPLGS